MDKIKDKDESFGIDLLKQEYEEFREKYTLPEFYEINKLFDIEDIDVETDFLLRKVRRVISDKVSNYLRFIEVVLNPSNAPMFFFKLVKKLEGGDRESLSEIYEMLGDFEIKAISLDLDYSEEKEVEFIKEIFKVFNEVVRGKLIEIVEKLGNGKDGKKREIDSSYCG